MPFDMTSEDTIARWQIESHDYRRKAKWANTDHERDAYLRIADSYDSLIKSEELMIEQRRRGMIHYLTRR